MTDYQVTIEVSSMEEAEGILKKIKEICQDIIEGGGKDAEKYAQTVIPKRTGRLRGGTNLTLDKEKFQLKNDVYYGPFVDQGHRIVVHPRGHGRYLALPAHQVGYFSGEHFSEKIWRFVKDDVNERCKAFLALK